VLRGSLPHTRRKDDGPEPEGSPCFPPVSPFPSVALFSLSFLASGALSPCVPVWSAAPVSAPQFQPPSSSESVTEDAGQSFRALPSVFSVLPSVSSIVDQGFFFFVFDLGATARRD